MYTTSVDLEFTILTDRWCKIDIHKMINEESAIFSLTAFFFTIYILQN